MTPDHVIRPAVVGDASFVVDTWLRSYRKAAWAARIPGDVFFSRYGHMGWVEDMVRGGRALVLVACLPSDPSFIFGWAAWDPDRGHLHYVYVKEDWRGKRLARALFTAVVEQPAPAVLPVTAETPAWRRFADAQAIAWRFKHPYREEKR